MAYPPEELAADLLNETDAETGVDDAAGLEADGGTPGEGDHAAHHNDAAAAINTIVAELGANPSGAETTVQARLEALGSALANKADTATVNSALAAKASKEELTTGLSGKSNTGHTHTQADITNLPPVFTAAKTANQNLTVSNTTLQNITELAVAIGASSSEVWRITYWLLVEAANTVMDLKVGFTVPASAAGRWGGSGSSSVPWSAVTIGSNPIQATPLSEAFSFGTRAGIAAIPITAIVHGGGTAGNVQIQASQNTSDPGQATVLKDSIVEALRVQP